MATSIDLTGQRFGRLTVLGRVWRLNNTNTFWLCRCDCGTLRIVLSNDLRVGKTKSCGCLNKENITTNGLTHGMTYSKLYRIWKAMKERCQNPNHKFHSYYGGRGIIVCEEWQKFEPFYEWSMKNGYSDELEIDRIDVNGNYEPSNCRWVTRKINSNNRRNNRLIEYNGETHTLSEWSEILGIKSHTLTMRFKYNWSIEKTFTTPVGKKKVH